MYQSALKNPVNRSILSRMRRCGLGHHQYKDGSRIIGTSLSGTLADGISGFVSYEVLLGYQGIGSHSINFGTRMEF